MSSLDRSPSSYLAGERAIVAKERAVNVLIVEDNPDDIELAMMYLRRTGVEVRINSVDDGDKALAFFQGLAVRSPEVPEFVLLDGSMPNRRGREVLKEIRRRHENVCVVMYSGSTSEEEKKIAKELGASDYIVKPMMAGEMDTVVTQLREMLSSIQRGETRSGGWARHRPARAHRLR